MIAGTLTRYMARRFFTVLIGAFGSLFVLVLMLDFVELLRRTSDLNASALLVAQVAAYRTPHITERVIPFTILISTMVCYLSMSRRLELVVVRSAGVSAWQFVMPALILSLLVGIGVTTIYNPISSALFERSERLESLLFDGGRNLQTTESNQWLRQRSQDGQSIIHAATSRQQGAELSDVTIFTLDHSDNYIGRIEAKRAILHDGFWRLEDARIYAGEELPANRKSYDLKTNLSRVQVQESFATPETVPFWQLSSFINLAENSGLAAAGYRLHFYRLLTLPLQLASMVLLAAAVSLRMFRFGGVQKMILSGIAAGLFLYVLSKIVGDLSKANMLTPLLAATLPTFIGGIIGTMALLYQEDG